MKKFILIMISFSFISIYSNSLYAYAFGFGLGSGSPIVSQVEIEKGGLFDPLINIYNKLIDLTKNSIEKNMSTVARSANALLSAMATAYIVVMGARSFLTGSQFLSTFVEKMFLFLVLSALLQFSWYDKYILKNLEALFNNLPTIFSFHTGGGDIITNIIDQNSKTAAKILASISGSWITKIFSSVIGAIAIASISCLTLIVLLNVLILTVEFYFVLSLSSLLILLFFFKFTRNFCMGAVQIVFGAIMKITCLSLFLSLFGSIIAEALDFDKDAEFVSACMGVILISFIGVALIKIVNEIANRITGGLSQMAGVQYEKDKAKQGLPHLGSIVKNTISDLSGGK